MSCEETVWLWGALSALNQYPESRRESFLPIFSIPLSPFFPFCHSLPFLVMLSLSPFGSQLVSWSFDSTLFSLTIIKPYFPSSPGLNVLAHKGTNPHLTYTFRTFIFYCTLNFKAKNILFILRLPLNLPSPEIELYSFITLTNILYKACAVGLCA